MAARFAGPGQRFEVVAVASTEEWALALVSAGVGIAIIPEGASRRPGPASRDDTVVLRPLQDVQARREVGVAYRAYGASEAPAPELQRIVELLVDRAHTLAPPVAGRRPARARRPPRR